MSLCTVQVPIRYSPSQCTTVEGTLSQNAESICGGKCAVYFVLEGPVVPVVCVPVTPVKYTPAVQTGRILACQQLAY